MNAAILCLAFIAGLLSTAFVWGGYAVLSIGIVASVFVKRVWRGSPKPQVWLIAGIIGLLASLYFQMRIPQPATNDISRLIENQQQVVTVQGKITSTPRLTRSQRGQFWLLTSWLEGSKVTGKVYVTVPLLQATGLYPGQRIAVTGVLYQPSIATNPGGFDFRAYLARESTFAGLSGRRVEITEGQKSSKWGWWKIRQKIVRSQVRWLGSPEGSLVSSMVIGGKAVDLPYDIRDLFVQVGLAHALAASGFQTSLILGVMLALLRQFSLVLQVSFTGGALLLFLGLTGMQPSVLRAVVMGFAVLVAIGTKRKVKPLGSLLFAATLLLLFNPLWIWDLGFQLSFLATLGLLVTVPPLIKRLDWLPVAIATLIAVPLAATLWTLPLQLQVFGIVPLYSLVVNVLSTPLISVISIGGIVSAIASIVYPFAGSALAWLLYYPTHFLIGLIGFFAQLPGNSIAVGRISVLQLLMVYGLIILAWLQLWWQKRSWLVGVIAMGIILVPIWHSQATVFRATVLATASEPVLVIQDQGKVVLVNSGDLNTVRFTVLPFLQQQGINQIEWAIATDSETSHRSWEEINRRLPVKNFYTSTSSTERTPALANVWRSERTLIAGDTKIQINDDGLQLQIKEQTWLLLTNVGSDEQKQLVSVKKLPDAQVLWWSGETLAEEILAAVKPEVAIASTTDLSADVLSLLDRNKIQLLWTGRDGAIQWTPKEKFEATVDEAENSAAWL
ncbi:ComEC/Rec2 family competence protein [Gloeocapsopsis crepidinum LEGE 06123]|uniref:ComEC/Rec2 family competence protein n=1 Tax=Gloeocapsopsis crepidinum LEGE 06123 TaxID=588587 RepID=A0ABR9UZK7_9CHRO|nr:ComEC/Rec2 family competence protein [Gloeocapsopsis crepidinum]MBE9192668.1 ComEC/Rec2 family competence protein [Gloeocapsopsis crepidinum LEGE 06123]